MENISEHITYDEATYSSTAAFNGIKNIPNKHELESMKIVAQACFEPVRRHYNAPLRIDSFFRCVELNRIIQGARSSQHMKGEAIDFTTGDSVKNMELFNWMKANLKYDQLIAEQVNGKNGGCQWIHVSFKLGANRNMVLYKKLGIKGYLENL